MTLVEAETQKVVREADFDIARNLFAAAWAIGANGTSLPSDMAKIVAHYIDKPVPAT